jgi:hypothetical protein
MIKRCIIPKILYGTEVGRIGNDAVRRFEVFLNDCRRTAIGAWRGSRITKEELESRVPLGDVRKLIAQRTLQWIAKAEKDDTLHRLMAAAATTGGRRGRPINAYYGKWKKWCNDVIDGNDKCACDICGKIMQSSDGVAIHKARMHKDMVRGETICQLQVSPAHV